jgi:hypothetical protein
MLTLPTHTSHVLHPLDVTYFKPFKTDFKKEKDFAMAKKTILNQTKLH